MPHHFLRIEKNSTPKSERKRSNQTTKVQMTKIIILCPSSISIGPRKKLKILNLARNDKIVILSEWDRLKPIIFLNIR